VRVAFRIRKRLATDSQQPPFSVSIGVAAYPQDGETVEALLEIADRELYGMKIRAADRPFPSVLAIGFHGADRFKKTALRNGAA